MRAVVVGACVQRCCAFVMCHALMRCHTGATGATGREVVAQLLERPEKWTQVTTIGRSRVEDLPPGHSVNLAQAETEKRLVQQARRAHSLSV